MGKKEFGGQLIYGYHALKAVLSRQPAIVQKIYFQHNRKDERLQQLKLLAAQAKISTLEVDSAMLESLLGEHKVHQGIVAQCTAMPYLDESALDELLPELKDSGLLLLLDGVQDPQNLGACLRTANAMGVDAVIAPKRRAAGLTPTVVKVACGAAAVTPFIQVTNLVRTMQHLQSYGFWLAGADADVPDSLDQTKLLGPLALVMGGEGRGLRHLTKQHCDLLISIPMKGSVSSLNVGAATAICLYEIQRQRGFSSSS